MTFTRSRSFPLMSPYFPNGSAVSSAVDYVMDLDFKLSYNCDPSAYIDKHVYCKNLKTLGFLSRDR